MELPLDIVPSLPSLPKLTTKTTRVKRTRKGKTVEAEKPELEFDCPEDMLGQAVGSALERVGCRGVKKRLTNDTACWNNLKKVQTKYKDKFFGAWMLEIVTCGQVVSRAAQAYRKKKNPKFRELEYEEHDSDEEEDEEEPAKTGAEALEKNALPDAEKEILRVVKPIHRKIVPSDTELVFTKNPKK